ncbi:META domain-containing protein [Alteriqipengyuania sp.]|uniref:META domain-containing protein n=1 Tax=Alteriqipengyuania sp. TaxID=2800692 RepID=UPI0035185F81
MKSNLLFTAAALAMSLSACATVPNDTGASQVAMVETISGTLTYRERVALPPSAQMEIVVSDITLGRNEELILSRKVITIGQASPPIPFSIDVSKLNLSDGPLYGLRAFIREPDGTIMFRTSEPFLLNLRSNTVDIGDIRLSMTSPDDPGLAGIPGLQDGAWRVTQIAGDVVPRDSAPTMTFATDGRLYGSTSCNRFNSSYSLDGTSLEVGTVAATKRACEAGLMQQERRFLDAISLIENASLEDGGFLVLSGKGQRIVAVRN